MPGFSHDDQQLLAFLALGHQGTLAKVRPYAPGRERWLALCCLRLAVLLLRRREPLRRPAPDSARAQAHACACRMSCRTGSRPGPLSGFQLKRESRDLAQGGVRAGNRQRRALRPDALTG